MKKLLTVLISILFFSVNASSVNAAVLKINKDGNSIWQVLGDETSNLKIPQKPDITIKNIAENISPTNNLITLGTNDGKIVLNGMDVTNVKDGLVEIEARDNSNAVKISNKDGQFNIEENEINALTKFPITIDPNKNELSVETQSGKRLISVLPYEAVITLIRNNIIDKVRDNTIYLDESTKGELEYQINGIKKINLFNITEINADVTSTVSATNGEVVKVESPQWLKFFGFIFNQE